MQLDANLRRYWSRTRRITAWLMAVWLVVTFVVAKYGDRTAQIGRAHV